MKTPNFILTEDYNTLNLSNNAKLIELPAGIFVRPIGIQWLPTHILQSIDYKLFNKESECFVYTSYGIVIVPKKLVRKV